MWLHEVPRAIPGGLPSYGPSGHLDSERMCWFCRLQIWCKTEFVTRRPQPRFPMIDTNETISGRKERRQQTAVRLLATLAAAEVVALAVLVVVLMVSLVHAWDLETWTLDAVAVTAAVILAAILGYVCYRFAIVAYRRRFQFSLRGLLGATAVLSLLLGTLGQQVLRYHHLHRVLDTGASFRYGPAQESRHPLKRGWIESRLGYDPFGRITSANLRTDQALLNMARHVESFSDLESLVLSSPCITDAGLADADGIARLPRLRSLNLIVCTGVTDSGLESLSRWSQVEVLLINSIPESPTMALGIWHR